MGNNYLNKPIIIIMEEEGITKLHLGSKTRLKCSLLLMFLDIKIISACSPYGKLTFLPNLPFALNCATSGSF